MNTDERLALIEKLNTVLREALAPEICTGTAAQMRERRYELARLMARVTGVVMYDELTDAERADRTMNLEDELQKSADKDLNHIWIVSPPGGGSTH